MSEQRDLTPDEADEADYWHSQGMTNAGVAGMLGAASQEAPQGSQSYNDSSGASGTYQYLGSRAAAEAAYAQARGQNPWSPQMQNEYANGELRGMADSGNERGVGNSLFHATDPVAAAGSMVRGFERPGADVADAESERAGRQAAALAPLLDQRYGKDGAPNLMAPLSMDQPSAADLAAEAKASAMMDQARQPAGAAGKWDNSVLPPTVRSPQPAGEADASALMDQARQKGIYAQKDPGSQPAPGTTWGPVGHALMVDLPDGLARGVMEAIGLPADLANHASDYYAAHPDEAAMLGSDGDMGWGGTAAAAALNPHAVSKDNLPLYNPNTKGMHIPLGTSNFEQLVKNVTGIDVTTPPDDTGGEVAGHMGEFIGAGLSPGGIASDIGKAASGAVSVTKTALGMLFHHILAPAGISGGLDAGQWAVDKATGNQAIGDAVGIGARAALGAAAFGGLGGGGLIGRTAAEGKKFISEGPTKAIDAALSSQHGEAGVPAARTDALNALTGYQEPIPGYTTPAALRTGDAALQQFAFDVKANDLRMHNDFTKPGGLATKNIGALEAMRPSGNAEDPVQAVQNTQARRQSVIEMRVAQARDAAEQAGATAATDTTGAPMAQGGGLGQVAGMQRGQAYIDELRSARDDAFDHADQTWQAARDGGFTTVQADVDPMYAKLEGLMSDAIRLRQGADFPWSQVNDLYRSGNPQGMFDKLGNRLPETIWSGPTIGGDHLFGDGTTLEQLKGVDSRLGNAIRMEQDRISAPGNGGNPSLLRSLTQVRNTVWQAIEDGAAAAGPQHTVALQNAMDATAQAYQNFGHGLIGQLLNERNGAANAPEILRQHLGNTQNAIQAASMFQSAMAQRTGAAAARQNLGGMVQGNPLGATPQQQFSRALADWMRQDYLNTRADLGAGPAQKWLTTRQGMFQRLSGNPDIDTLHQQLMDWQNAADVVLPQMVEHEARSSAELAHNSAQLFLNGSAGNELDKVFRAKNPAGAMGDIIADVKADGSGRAFTGLQDLVLNRVFDEAQRTDPMRPGQTYYSGIAAQKFLGDNQAAISRLAQEDPRWAQGLQRVVDTMALEDRARMGTGLQLGGGPVLNKSGWSASGSLATKALQYTLAHVVGRNLPAAGLQGEALSSQFGKELAQHVPANITAKIQKLDPTDAVRSAVRDALHDPEKLRGLLAPVTGPSGQRWATQLEPWLRATGVTMPQGWLNPQNRVEPGEEQPQ